MPNLPSQKNTSLLQKSPFYPKGKMMPIFKKESAYTAVAMLKLVTCFHRLIDVDNKICLHDMKPLDMFSATAV